MKIQTLRTDDCIDEVIEKYKKTVYRLAFSIMKNKADADDVFQEVFLRYIEKNRSFESEEHRKAWLIKVTVNCCKKIYNSAARKRTVSLYEAVEDGYLHKTDDLLELLDKLEPKYRSVIHLYYYEDMTTEEIAAVLGRKPSTVRSRLARARQMLKERLEGDGFNE